ncbi:MAG: hypothetical protein CM1200mP20_16340 [Pseudomonadota bacterium]|nr:MAG: hypothetical protein CM1200mP20_16340 [Pseudomonadota bacterium]
MGDLKNVLTNVKVRGTWAEYQLEAILTQVLTPEQFDRNVATKEGSAERVEFAIRLPGRSDDPDDCVWLPIDSKFPQEDYLRLAEAAREGTPTRWPSRLKNCCGPSPSRPKQTARSI